MLIITVNLVVSKEISKSNHVNITMVMYKAHISDSNIHVCLCVCAHTHTHTHAKLDYSTF